MRTQKESGDILALFIFAYGNRWTVHLFPVAVPGIFVGAKRHSQLPTAALTAPSLDLPPAALGLVTNPNTEVKLICADDSCRATGRENR